MALKTIGAASTYKFGTGDISSTKKILEHSSSKEFTRSAEAKDNGGEIIATVRRGQVETVTQTEYSTATSLDALPAPSGSSVTQAQELMASNQDFVKVRTTVKNYDFASGSGGA
jgi:hypothetical protein